MPWKDVEKRKSYRRKKYAEQRANGQKRDWGKVEVICPVCQSVRFIGKNQHGITKWPKDEDGRIIRRCRSCSRINPDAKVHNTSILIDEHRKKRMAQKVRAIRYLGGKCMDCDLVYDGTNAYAFDFHHRDPSQKKFLPTSKNYSWEKCRIELDKCDLLCAICHRARHSEKY